MPPINNKIANFKKSSGIRTLNLYSHPQYYEIAFEFRDIEREVNFFEEALRKFSHTRGKRVLELASGTSPYLREWHRRGYQYTGLDASHDMIHFVKTRARAEHIPAHVLHGDMNHFSFRGTRFDAVYVLLGSLYSTSNDEFLRHMDSVSRSLKKGGLYLLDGVVWFNLLRDNKQSWTISRDGIRIRASFRARLHDPVQQTFFEELVLNVNDRGVRKRLESNILHKFFFPQEFRSLVACHGEFEFIGWFDNFDLRKPATPNGRQIVILRKR